MPSGPRREADEGPDPHRTEHHDPLIGLPRAPVHVGQRDVSPGTGSLIPGNVEGDGLKNFLAIRSIGVALTVQRSDRIA